MAFISQAEFYIEKLIEKAQKDANKAKKASSSSSEPEVKTWKKKAGFYKEESSDSEQEVWRKKKETKWGWKKVVSESSQFENSDVSEEESDPDSEWDDECYKCKKKGDVICCESCPHVVHIKCIGLKTNPTGDWNCEDCVYKQVNMRQTRGAFAKKQRK